MHELSIAHRVVEIAAEYAQRHGATHVRSITLRLGALSCVHPSALEFCFEQVAEGTLVEGAKLNFIDVPVTIHCATCAREMELASIQRLVCPVCGTPGTDVRRGRELEVESLEVLTEESPEVP